MMTEDAQAAAVAVRRRWEKPAAAATWAFGGDGDEAAVAKTTATAAAALLSDDGDDGEHGFAGGSAALALSPPRHSSHCDVAPDDDGLPVLFLELFKPHPTLDFGAVPVGQSKTLHLLARNPGLLPQGLSADKVPSADGFSLGGGGGGDDAAASWATTVAPHGSVALPVTWAPTTAGAFSKTLLLKLDGKHRLQVRLLGKATEAFAAQQQHRRQPLAALRAGDQAARPPPRRGLSDTGAKPAIRPGAAVAGQPPQQRPPAAAATTKPAMMLPPAAKPSLGRPPARVSAGGAAAAGGTSDQAGRVARPPPRSSSASGSQLRLKVPAAAASGAPKAPGSPTGSVAAGSVRSSSGGGRPGSSAGGGRPSSSVRKTFKFYHTELWMAKQDRAFTAWLNHLLLPFTPEYLKAAYEGGTGAALADLRLAARARGAMVALYRSDAAVRDVMVRLEGVVDAGKLRLRPDSVLLEDVAERRAVLDALMAYNPFWLRLALEVVTQRPVLPPPPQATTTASAAAAQGGDADEDDDGRQQQPQQQQQQQQPVVGFGEALRAFVLRDFLSDRDMVAEMEAQRGAAHFNMDAWLVDLGALQLKRFLLLVLLMDRAAAALHGAGAASSHRAPLLFRVAGGSGGVKASRDAVLRFLHGRVVGEGNVVRHLEMLGFKLSYAQSPLMEYPFSVASLATDLRDGLRLLKVAEVLTGDGALLAREARLPADRRPLQLHNTGAALAALAAAGVPLHALPTTGGLVALRAEDVVDGDRERTLSLLWATARTLQLGAVLRLPTLRAEVARVLARTHLAGVRPLPQLALLHQGGSSSSSSSGRRRLPASAAAAACELAVYMQDELLSSLMAWVQAVGAAYGVAVTNFAGCFGDGVVLCLLVHHYLPNAVRLEDVYVTRARRAEAARASSGGGRSQQLLEAAVPTAVAGSEPDAAAAAADGLGSRSSSGSLAGGGGWAAQFDVAGFGGAEAEREQARGVAANFRAVHRAAAALGGVPEMLSSRDFAEHGPDERAVILYAAFLCARLLECSRDDRAAHVIQTAWRKARSHAAGVARASLRQWVAAATVVQRGVRAWLLRRRLRALVAVHRDAAAALQAAWRGRAVRAAIEEQRAAAVRVQAAWRAVLAARAEAARRHAAATAIAAAWRGFVVRRAAEARKRLGATVRLQAGWRGYVARARLARQRRAAVTLQAAWRGFVARDELAGMRCAAVVVQAAWRGAAARTELAETRAVALALQAAWRGRAVRAAIEQSHALATFLQACCRARRERAAFLRARAAATVLQAAWRGRAARAALARALFARQDAAATTIQAAWRAHKVEQAHARDVAAVVSLQALVRRQQARAAYEELRGAAIMLQAAVRGAQVRRQLAACHAAAADIQAAWRGHALRRQLAACHAAATAIQAGWRGCVARAQVARQHAAATVVQAAWRGCAARAELARRQAAATAVQAAWRGFVAAEAFQLQRCAAVGLQAAWRGKAARAELARLRTRAAAATAIQAAWRGRAARARRAELSRAALALQAWGRGMLARRAARATRECVRAARELEDMLLMLHLRSRSATSIQAAWRGCRQRRAFAPVWAAHVEAKARDAAARALQAAWRGAAARGELRRLRGAAAAREDAALTLQAAWRGRCGRADAAGRLAAVVGLQAAVRGWAARRAAARSLAGVRRFQALWRGHRVRRRCGRAAREARRRLEEAAAAAAAAPQRRIGARTREALEVLLASRQCSQVVTAVAAIEFSTRYSKACCQLMVESGGVGALLAFMRACNRSKPHVEMLGHALACLTNICRWPDLLPGVLSAPDVVGVLSERLQVFRDTEAVFMRAVGILATLVRGDGGALAVARAAPSAPRLWDGIAQLLARKMEMERKYIERLEGQKGSDVTAREATRKLVAAATQLDALQRVIARVDAVAAAHGVPLSHLARAPAAEGAAGAAGAGLLRGSCAGDPFAGSRPATAAAAAMPAAAGAGAAPLPGSLAAAAASAALPAAAAGGGGACLVPRSAAAVVSRDKWQPKNTIVRSAMREVAGLQRSMAAAGAGAAPPPPQRAPSPPDAAEAAEEALLAAVQRLEAETPPRRANAGRPATGNPLLSRSQTACRRLL